MIAPYGSKCFEMSQIDVRTCRKYNLGVEMNFGLVDDVLTLVDNDSTLLYTRAECLGLGPAGNNICHQHVAPPFGVVKIRDVERH